MAKYRVNWNTQPTGKHEVHKEGCPHAPNPPICQHLEAFDQCSYAVAAA